MTARSFGAVLQAHAIGGRAGEPAISYPGETVSWAELDARSAAGARRLIALSVKPDDFVAVALPNGIDHHISSFAAWRAGATPCVLPKKLPGRELAQIVELEGMSEGAVGKRRCRRTGASKLRSQDRARTVAADMARELLHTAAPGQTAAEQGYGNGIDHARLGHGDHGRWDILVAQ